MRASIPVAISFGLGFVAFMAASCGKDKKTLTAKNKPVPLSELTVESMKISKSLGFKLPAGLKKLGKSAAALSLSSEASGKKSTEACRTAGQVNELFFLLSAMSYTFCTLEAESAQIEFGKKYELKFTEGEEGDETIAIWIDNSQADKLTVYQCSENKLAQKIEISSATEAGVKGSMILNFAGSDQDGTYSFASSINFDMSTEGTKELKSDFKYEIGANTAYAQSVVIKMNDLGVSRFGSSIRGTYSGSEVLLRGYLKHSGNFGQAVLKGAVTETGAQPKSFSSRSTFNADGHLIDNSSAAPELKVEKTEIPALLPATYSVQAPTGWDCKATETITVPLKTGPRASAHKACEQSFEEVSFDDCFGDDYFVGNIEDFGE